MSFRLSSPFSIQVLLSLFLVLVISACSQRYPVLSDYYKPDTSVTKKKLPDFSRYAQVDEKKSAFSGFMLPLINEANREIRAERTLIKDLPLELEGKTPGTLKRLVEKYRIPEGTREAQIRALLKQVNEIPPSLAMAQAANESAWGTSRFAREANNLYGEWCFVKGCGLVPKRRSSGSQHEVASFVRPFRSVQSYMLNINRHESYAGLRSLRNQQIAEQGYATGLVLAAGLENYSERGDEYIKEIRSMISVNDFDRFDGPEAGPENGQ